MTVGIAFIGCGYVADLYQSALANWDETLELKGVYDRDPKRLKAFTKHYGLESYPSFDALLTDPDVEIVVNLTNPDEHYAVTKQALEAGRHVYSEKPLAMDLVEAEELIELASDSGVYLVCAPSSALGEAAQALAREVRGGSHGTPHLVYAELDDGMVHKIGYQNWKTASGAFWPATDEFKTGCTIEHAGYALTWLVAMFGGVRRVVSFASCIVPDKGKDTPENYDTPDFSCACLEFDGGVIARMTNSIIAPHDHRFRVFCENSVLEVDETWDYSAKVRVTPVPKSKMRRGAIKLLGLTGARTIKPKSPRKIATAKRGYPMDFALGVAEMAEAIREDRTPRLAGEFSLHITEVSLAIQYPDRFGTDYRPISAPGPVAAMEWGPAAD